MWRMHDDYSWILLELECNTREEFRNAVAKVVKRIIEINTILRDLNDNEQTDIKQIDCFIESFKNQYKAGFDLKLYNRNPLKNLKEIMNESDRNFEPIESSKFLDLLKIFEGDLVCG